MKRSIARISAACLAVLAITTSPATAQAPAKPAEPALSADADWKLLQGTWEGVEKGREAAGKCNLTISRSQIGREFSGR